MRLNLAQHGKKLTRFRRGIWLSVSSRAMSIRTHFCVVQCYSQLGWPVIKGGKPIWNPDPHHGFVDAFLFSAIWHALGDRVCGPEFRWLPQAPPLSVAKAHTLLLNSVAHYAGRLESDAVVLFGWNLGIPRWAEATYGKLLEHTPHAQPSQVVVVVPTDFGFDGWKDRDGILQEAVLQCFQERRRTVKVDLVSEDTLPQFRFRCQYLSSQVSNGNLRRAAGGLARCPPPKRRSRSPRRNFTVDVSDSDDEFGLPYGRLSPSSSDAVHLRRPYTKREGSNE